MRRRFSPILFQNLYDCGSDDGTIGKTGHLTGLFRCGDAKTDRAGDPGVFPDGGNDRFQIGFDLTADSCHAQTGDHIYKALRFPGNPGDTVLRGGRDQGNQADIIFPAVRQKFLFLLKWQIRQDQAVNARLLTSADKTVRAI